MNPVVHSMDEGPDLPSADDPKSAFPTALPVGLRLGHFVIEDVISQGEYGFVYQARDTLLARRVAIKEYFPQALCTRGPSLHMQPRGTASPGVIAGGRDAFIEEARMLSRLEHPGLVGVLAAFEAHQTAYRVMPLYEGITLAEARAQRKHAPDAAWLATWLRALLEPVETLHQAGVVHGFIHPEQVMLLPGDQPLLLGFGTARRALHAPLDHAYAPLEQSAMGGHLPRGAWTDLYSAAAVTWFFGVGRGPASSTERNGGTNFMPGSELAAALGVPMEGTPLFDAIERALTLAPSNRLQSVGELRDALDGRLPGTSRMPEPPRPRKQEPTNGGLPPPQDEMETAVRNAIARAVDSIPPAEPGWKVPMHTSSVVIASAAKAKAKAGVPPKVEPGLSPKTPPAASPKAQPARAAAPAMPAAKPPPTQPSMPPLMPPAMELPPMSAREAADAWHTEARPQAAALVGHAQRRSSAATWIVAAMVLVIGSASAWRWNQSRIAGENGEDETVAQAPGQRVLPLPAEQKAPSVSTSPTTSSLPNSPPVPPAATTQTQPVAAVPTSPAQLQVVPSAQSPSPQGAGAQTTPAQTPPTQTPPTQIAAVQPTATAPQIAAPVVTPVPLPQAPSAQAPQHAAVEQPMPARAPVPALPPAGDLHGSMPPTAAGQQPPAQSTVTEAKTPPAAPVATDAPVHKRPARVSTPPPVPAKRPVTSTASAAPSDPRDLCRGRSNFALLYCVQTACAKPQYSASATCARVRRTGEVE